MPDEPLLPPPDPPAPDDPPRRSRPRLVCEFCECVLAPTGEVLKRGDEARRLARIDEALETARAEVARAVAETATVREELRALQATTARSDRLRIPVF